MDTNQYTIYLIENTVSGTVYIGQTTRPVERRWSQHRYSLIYNHHNNPHLQASWNKYGATAFEFCVLETHTSLETMNEAEHFLISYFRAIGVKLYNSKQGGDNGLHSEESKAKRRGRKMSAEAVAKMRERVYSEIVCKKIQQANIERSGIEFRLISPEGKIFEGYGLNKFCRTHNLYASLVCKVLQGKRSHHKGWTVAGAYTEAERQLILEVWQTGKPSDLTRTKMSQEKLGTHISETAKQKLRDFNTEAQRQKMADVKARQHGRVYSIQSPDGQLFKTNNLAAFCREHHLNKWHMSSIMNGQRKSHKGWTKGDVVTPDY